jgi:hypothetical protein
MTTEAATVRCEVVIRAYLDHIGAGFSCARRDGFLWVISPFQHPDSDFIEVAVQEAPTGRLVVSDLGETLRHLADFGYDPRATPKGDYLLTEVLKQHNVELHRGAVTKRVGPAEVGSAVYDVIAACLAVGQLLYLSRSYRPATFAEEVSHFLAERHVPFRSDHKETGLSGRPYTIDYFISGTEKDGLIQTLSPSQPASATGMVNATSRLWSDVPNHRWRASVLDDRQVQWRTHDVTLLRRVSEVYVWTERDGSFAQDLKALGAEHRSSSDTH